jgi:hypothetical protein
LVETEGKSRIHPEDSQKMRKLSISLLAAAVVFAVAGVSQAGTFDDANSSLTIRLAGLPPIAIPGNPGGNAVSGAGPVVTEGPTGVKPFGPANVDIPDSLFTGVPQISDLRISGLDKPGGTAPAVMSAGNGFGGGFGGVAPLSGNTTICVFQCLFIQVAIPLGIIGGGGTFTGTALGQPLTVTGTGWTTGAAAIAGINTEVVSFAGNQCAPVTCPVTTLAAGTGIGVYLGTVTLTGTNTLTAGGNGMVTLVSPALTDSLAGALPLFAIQKLVFTGVPEPGTLLLLGTGIAGLLVYGRKRMHS